MTFNSCLLQFVLTHDTLYIRRNKMPYIAFGLIIAAPGCVTQQPALPSLGAARFCMLNSCYCTVRFRNTHRNIILHVYINCTEAFTILSFYIVLTTSSRCWSYEEFNTSSEVKDKQCFSLSTTICRCVQNIFNLSSRWRLVINFNLKPFYSFGSSPDSNFKGGWVSVANSSWEK